MATQARFKNLSQLNTVRVSYQDVDNAPDAKTGKPIPNRWKKSSREPLIVKAGEAADVWVAAGVIRAIIEELPT